MARAIKRRKKPQPKTKLKKLHGRAPIRVSARKIKRRKGSYKRSRNKLTRRTRQILFEAIGIGMSRISACALAGIASKTFSDYMEYGKDPSLTKYYRFRKKIKSLEAKRQKEALEVIRACGNGGRKLTKTKIVNSDRGLLTQTEKIELAPQWQAAAWYLERKDKVNWGRDSIQESKTPTEVAQEILEAQMMLMNSVPTQPNPEEDLTRAET